MTGIDDPYEPPGRPDVVVGTVGRTPEESARTVWRHLVDRGFVEDAARRPVTGNPPR
jgi:adenylylsulfate kinase